MIMSTFGTIARPLGIFLLVILQCCSGFYFCFRSRALVSPCNLHGSDRRRLSRRDLDQDESDKQTDRSNDDDSYTWAQIQADEKLRKLEFDASMKRKKLDPTATTD